MPQRDDDGSPVDHDPTGMRDLLSRLPDPGPMPPDLVARITASLTAESRAAGAQAPVLPLPGRSRAARRWQVLGVAAAVVGVVGLGGLLLADRPGGLQASLGLSDSAADSEAAELRPTDGVAGGGAGPDTSRAIGETVVVVSGRTYASARLGVDAAALVAVGADAGSAPAAGSPGTGPVATAAGARACADALGVSPESPVVVDLATLDGIPAVVLVAVDGGAHTAWAVRASCSAGAPGILAGPTPLTP